MLVQYDCLWPPQSSAWYRTQPFNSFVDWSNCVTLLETIHLLLRF